MGLFFQTGVIPDSERSTSVDNATTDSGDSGEAAYETDLEAFQAAMINQMMTPQVQFSATPSFEPQQMITGENPWDTAYVNAPAGVEVEEQYWQPPYANYRLETPRVMPQYTVDSPLMILNSMSSAELASLELQFVEAGYIEEEDILGGNRATLIGNFTTLVTSADYNRVDWEDQLQGDINDYRDWKEANPEQAPKSWRELNPFVAPAYKAPDYQTLAQASKESIRKSLGRDVTSGEMELLTGFLTDASKKAYQANEYNVDLANWEARARAQETGTDQTAGTVQQYDAGARYTEMFEDRFAGELEHREQVDTINRKEGTLFGSIDTISRMTS